MKILAIVVTYNPCKEQFQKVMDAIILQVEHIVVVDNTPDPEWDMSSFFENKKCTLFQNNKNIGLSKAQNIGIKWAMDHGYDYVLILDQDSLPENNMVQKLLDVSESLKEDGAQLAAVGPRFIDERNTNHPCFSRMSGITLVVEDEPFEGGVVLVDFLISSGSLILLEAINSIGLMDESLFIDQIDLEWGMRAKHLGYQCFGVYDAVMEHALGEDPLVILGKTVLNHGPLRHYYIFRNAIWLLKKGYAPIGWKVLLMKMIVMRFLLYISFIRPRLLYLKLMSLGLWHGLIGRMGKLND